MEYVPPTVASVELADEYERVLAVGVVARRGAAVDEAVLSVERERGLVALADFELHPSDLLAVHRVEGAFEQRRADPPSAIAGIDRDVLDVADRSAALAFAVGDDVAGDRPVSPPSSTSATRKPGIPRKRSNAR